MLSLAAACAFFWLTAHCQTIKPSGMSLTALIRGGCSCSTVFHGRPRMLCTPCLLDFQVGRPGESKFQHKMPAVLRPQARPGRGNWSHFKTSTLEVQRTYFDLSKGNSFSGHRLSSIVCVLSGCQGYLIRRMGNPIEAKPRGALLKQKIGGEDPSPLLSQIDRWPMADWMGRRVHRGEPEPWKNPMISPPAWVPPLQDHETLVWFHKNAPTNDFFLPVHELRTY